MKYFPLLFLLLFFLISCENHTILSSEKDIENQVWTYRDTFSTDFSIKNNNIPYDIMLNIVYNDEYPFQNIYLRITDNFTGKKNIDTVNINLYNKYGMVKGEKRGKDYDLSTILRKSFKFPATKKYSIKIEQYTRNDSLQGVSAVNLYINKAKK